VDVGAMEGVASHLVDSIQTATSSLPTVEAASAAVQSNRPIPAYNPEATTPSEVYALTSIAPPQELSSFSLSPFLSAETTIDRKALLPFRGSQWVNRRIDILFESNKPDRTTLKNLLYASAMFAFKSNANHCFHKSRPGDDYRSKLQAKMQNVPDVVLDGLVTRFAEMPRGSAKPQVTSDTETKLLTHLFALCLRVDGYATEIGVLAADLHMPVVKAAQLFKSLGCRLEIATTQERAASGMTLKEAQESKKAVLRIPLEFPKPRSGKTGKR